MSHRGLGSLTFKNTIGYFARTSKTQIRGIRKTLLFPSSIVLNHGEFCSLGYRRNSLHLRTDAVSCLSTVSYYRQEGTPLHLFTSRLHTCAATALEKRRTDRACAGTT